MVGSNFWCQFNSAKPNDPSCICGVSPEVGPYDAYTYLTIAPICICLSSSIIYTYFKMPQFRQREGDLILFISLSDLLLGFHWTANGIYSVYTFANEPFSEESEFCKYNGFFSTIGGTGTLIYNVSFVLYIAIGLRYKLTTSKIKSGVFHAMSIGTVIFILCYGYAEQTITQSIWGTCSISVKNTFGFFSFFTTLGIITPYASLVILVLFYARRALPKGNPIIEPIRKKFLQFYQSYLTYSLIIWSVIGFFYCIGVFYSDPRVEEICSQNTYWGKLLSQIFGISKFVNSVKMLSIFALTLLRLTDPTMSKFIFSFHKEKLVDGALDEPTFVTISQQMQYSLQVAYTNAILSNISLVYLHNRQDQSSPSRRSEEKKKINFRGRKRISIKNLSLSERSVAQDLTKGLNVHITEYAPEAFMELREADELGFDFTRSLDVKSNMERIRKAAKSDGGASGEFFFFTFDDRLIIKSVTSRELNKMMSMLEAYCKHFVDNPESMIAKIYGIYSIISDNKNKVQFNLILMRNTVSMPRKYILRTYDMKGSTVSREVLKKGEQSEDYLRQRTLKDIDFLKLEKTVNINPHVAQRVYRSFEKDTWFFLKHNIMDYSILLVKIDKQSYLKRDPEYQESSLNPATLMSIPSNISEEDGVYYNIAIIDYLQEYNCEKKMERMAKQLQKCKKGLDVSAINPRKFRDRFLRFSKKILLGRESKLKENELC